MTQSNIHTAQYQLTKLLEKVSSIITLGKDSAGNPALFVSFDTTPADLSSFPTEIDGIAITYKTK